MAREWTRHKTRGCVREEIKIKEEGEKEHDKRLLSLDVNVPVLIFHLT